VSLNRPEGLRRFDRRGEQPIAVVIANPEEIEILTEMEHNLERLILDI